MEQKKKKQIVILSVGGTIAGAGKGSHSTRYRSGVVPPEQLLENIPGIYDLADLKVLEVCRINSDDITDRIWLRLSALVNSLLDEPAVDGIVILHGTDTMEETAYFLHLTVHSAKPVILTGAIRPSTARSADGPMNLYEAAAAAVSEQSAGQGTLLVFSGRILSARFAVKDSSDSITAFTGGEQGILGTVSDRSVMFYQSPVKRHTVSSEFAPLAVKQLPRVSVLFFHADADPSLLQYASDHSDGIVIAGAGAGEFSSAFADTVRSLSIPVVVSSSVRSGRILQESLLCENTVSSQDLSPQKAAVLLRLALSAGLSRQEDLIRIFSEY